MLDGFPTREAEAVCTFAFCASGADDVEPIVFEGRTLGDIVQARGPANFGWDPILEIRGTGKTYAEMEPAEKNKVRLGDDMERVCGMDRARSPVRVDS